MVTILSSCLSDWRVQFSYSEPLCWLCNIRSLLTDDLIVKSWALHNVWDVGKAGRKMGPYLSRELIICWMKEWRLQFVICPAATRQLIIIIIIIINKRVSWIRLHSFVPLGFLFPFSENKKGISCAPHCLVCYSLESHSMWTKIMRSLDFIKNMLIRCTTVFLWLCEWVGVIFWGCVWNNSKQV